MRAYRLLGPRVPKLAVSEQVSTLNNWEVPPRLISLMSPYRELHPPRVLTNGPARNRLVPIFLAPAYFIPPPLLSPLLFLTLEGFLAISRKQDVTSETTEDLTGPEVA